MKRILIIFMLAVLVLSCSDCDPKTEQVYWWKITAIVNCGMGIGSTEIHWVKQDDEALAENIRKVIYRSRVYDSPGCLVTVIKERVKQ